MGGGSLWWGTLDLRQGWGEQVGVGLVHQGPEFRWDLGLG